MLNRPEIEALQRETAAHYEAHPLDFMTPEDEAYIELMQPPQFRKFVTDHIKPGLTAAEIGCGPGRGTLYLEQKNISVAAVDISQHSLSLAKRRAPSVWYVRASNLELPFTDGSFDVVVSDGVIHHTPDARGSFRENVRILKPGGYFYLGLYNRRGYYYYLYTYLGPPIRWLESFSLGRLIVHATLIPLYFGVHLIKSRGKRTWRGAQNFFYDYIITPRASFHTREEVEAWCRDEKLDLLTYDPNLGNIHVFVAQKRAE